MLPNLPQFEILIISASFDTFIGSVIIIFRVMDSMTHKLALKDIKISAFKDIWPLKTSEYLPTIKPKIEPIIELD